MATAKCNVDKTLNDYMVYCWYRGCWPEQMLMEVEGKWLYIARSVNDAAIVWNEGIPSNTEVNDAESIQQWVSLSEKTGQTAA
jgi:hypothetical protein